MGADRLIAARRTCARIMCIIAMIAASLMMGDAAHAQNQFTFRVCNNSHVPTIGIAVRFRTSAQPLRYRTIGWEHVSAGECRNLGPYPKGPFWFHAEESGTAHPSIQWGSGSHFCVDREAKFALDAGEGHTCDKSREAPAFEANVQDDTYTWRAGDRPQVASDGQSECQNACVRQYNACREENGPNCLTLRQGCWDRCPAGNRPSPTPSPAQASGGQFRFHVCNKSRWNASVAVTYVQSHNPDRFMTRGWKNLKPGECSMEGPYPKGRFWYYAFVKDGPQWAGDVGICVDKRAGFTRSYGSGEPCRLDTVKFRQTNVQNDPFEWSLGD